MKNRKSKSTQTIIKSRNIKKIRKNSKTFGNLPVEIIEQIFLQIINHKCKQGHKWCFNIKTGHRYNRNRISILTNVCRSWTRIVYPYIWKRIELNRDFTLKEQKKTVKLLELLSDDDLIACNYINEIYINHNFLTNETISNIVKKYPNININIKFGLNEYILNKNNFNKDLLINFYKNSIDNLCISCKKEPVYWNSTYYLGFCLNCLFYKYNITLQQPYMKIIEKLTLLENYINL